MIFFLIIIFYVLILILKIILYIIVSIGEKEVDMYKIIENGEMGKERARIQCNNRRCEYTYNRYNYLFINLKIYKKM